MPERQSISPRAILFKEKRKTRLGKIPPIPYLEHMTIITVDRYEDGERLDAFLAQKAKGFSRTYFQKLIKAGSVTLNGKTPKAHTVVGEGDVIEFGEMPDKKEEAVEKLPPLKIHYEDKDIFVIEKPAGVLVHPAPNQKNGTLVDMILARDPAVKGVGEDPIRPGIVHRLDRDASGLMLVARTQKGFEHLKTQFKNRTIEKTYLALVHGKIVKESGIIAIPIGRSKDRGRMVARAQPLEGDKPAETAYDVVMRFPHGTLVEARPKTGRMHQIRVHMKAIGHPLAGDGLYTPLKFRTGSLRPPRMFLHSAGITFTDTRGERLHFESPLPEDLHAFLEALKKTHKRRQ